MKITKEIIRTAFKNTHYFSNGLDLDVVFDSGSQSVGGAWGDSYNLVYYLLENMRYDSNFRVICLHSDGGLRDYLITYLWGDYSIIISREVYMGGHTHFNSVEHLCEWLNYHDEKIINKIQ